MWSLVTRLKMFTDQQCLCKLFFLYNHKKCCCYLQLIQKKLIAKCRIYQLCMICNVCCLPRFHTQYMLMKTVNPLIL